MDLIHGRFAAALAVDPGDFVIARADGLYAYHLAVVVDDAMMGVTDVVRGYDLLQVTPPQIALASALGYPPVRYAHVPLLVDDKGGRLSKRRGDVDRRGLEAAGWTPELLRGAFAVLWGWASSLVPRSPRDLIDLASWSSLENPEIRVPDAFFQGPAAYDAHLTTHRHG